MIATALTAEQAQLHSENLASTAKFCVLPVLAETVLYAIFVMLISTSSYILVTRGSSKLMLAVTLIMFGLSTWDWAIDVHLLRDELKVFLPADLIQPPPDNSRRVKVNTALRISQAIVLLSDSVVCWRVYILYGQTGVSCGLPAPFSQRCFPNPNWDRFPVCRASPSTGAGRIVYRHNCAGLVRTGQYLGDFDDRVSSLVRPLQIVDNVSRLVHIIEGAPGEEYGATSRARLGAPLRKVFSAACRVWGGLHDTLDCEEHYHHPERGRHRIYLLRHRAHVPNHGRLPFLQLRASAIFAQRLISSSFQGMYPTLIIILVALKKSHLEHQFTNYGDATGRNSIRSSADCDVVFASGTTITARFIRPTGKSDCSFLLTPTLPWEVREIKSVV
ncbi:hypothetical protein B0H13DRAFT_2486397 [Mycena leptocephala]|nr:hypothetical protein B0H13DRAFT_2486397 [Mycena leptocephala]